MWESLKIILLCTAGAVAFGIGHDSFTVRMSLEYFTVMHPPVLGETQSPTLLALYWGTVATWWMGAGLGVLWAVAARMGSEPKWGWRDIVPILIIAVVGTGLFAAAAGFELISLFGPQEYHAGLIRYRFMGRLSEEQLARCLHALNIHSTAHKAGGAFALLGCLWVALRRAYLRSRLHRIEMS